MSSEPISAGKPCSVKELQLEGLTHDSLSTAMPPNDAQSDISPQIRIMPPICRYTFYEPLVYEDDVSELCLEDLDVVENPRNENTAQKPYPLARISQYMRTKASRIARKLFNSRRNQ